MNSKNSINLIERAFVKGGNSFFVIEKLKKKSKFTGNAMLKIKQYKNAEHYEREINKQFGKSVDVVASLTQVQEDNEGDEDGIVRHKDDVSRDEEQLQDGVGDESLLDLAENLYAGA